MSRKQKLELTWIGKDERPKLEPRILMEVPEKSYHAATRRTPDDQFDNLLIHGDNLLALKALEQEYAGKVKCVFIDPPYNTGSAFEHYDDGIEHSLWLSLMRDRIQLLHRLLSHDGSMWVTLDDNEAHYFKVLCDEIFGRSHFIANIIWQKKYAVANDHKTIAPMHDHILVYAKSSAWKRNLLARDKSKDKQYKYEDDKGVFRPDNYTCNKTAEERPNLYYKITNPNTGLEIFPNRTRVWAYSEDVHKKHIEDDLIYWGKNGKSKVPSFKRYKNALKNDGIVPQTIWTHDFAGHTDGSRKEVREVLGAKSLQSDFITPKPEKLVRRVLEIATNPGDIILDSFLGSGTTAAVAHKMGRRWIGIELGDHCYTHCLPRLRKVVDGADPGGITADVDWKGGGGFRFCELGPSLIRQDAWGNPVINAAFNPEMLAEALCKLEGFRYAPHPETFWMQGQSSESDFIYVTTQYVTAEMLAKLSAEVGNDRTLLLCCSAHDEASAPNITLRKIPNAVLQKCEWGKDDYSLSISSLPAAPPEDDEAESAGGNAAPARPARAPRGGRAANPRDDKARLQPSLFDLAPGDDA